MCSRSSCWQRRRSPSVAWSESTRADTSFSSSRRREATNASRARSCDERWTTSLVANPSSLGVRRQHGVHGSAKKGSEKGGGTTKRLRVSMKVRMHPKVYSCCAIASTFAKVDDIIAMSRFTE